MMAFEIELSCLCVGGGMGGSDKEGKIPVGGTSDLTLT